MFIYNIKFLHIYTPLEGSVMKTQLISGLGEVKT